MKNKFAAFAMLFMAVFTLASCLNDDTDYVYTDDSAITSFSVTGAKRYIHTKTKKGERIAFIQPLHRTQATNSSSTRTTTPSTIPTHCRAV